MQQNQGLRFLSPNSVMVLSVSHQKTLNNNTTIQIRNELFKLVNQVSSSFGPNGKFKLITDVHQSQIITRSGSQILEFIKTNNPIVQYLISLFSGVASEFCDGTISCLVLSYELLDLICSEFGNKYENINTICNYLHQIMERMFNNNSDNSLLKIKIGTSEELSIFIKSMINIQIQSNHLKNLIYEWFEYSSNGFKNLHLISEYNLNISKSLGKIDDSKLFKNSLTLQSLQNLNIRISQQEKVNQSKICILSCDLDQNIAMKIDCNVIILVGKQFNILSRRFIQILNERGVSVFFYQSNSMDLIFKLVDILKMTGIATCFENLKDYNYGLSNMKTIFKNNGQQCDLTFDFPNSMHDDVFSTLQLKSLNQENLNQVEFQIINCIRHVKHVIGRGEISAIIGGGSFECHLSNIVQTLAQDKEDELFKIIVTLVSKSLLTIPKMLLRNSLPQFNERYFFQLLEELVKKNNEEYVTFIQSTSSIQSLNEKPLSLIQRSELFQHASTTYIPLESFYNRKHIIQTAIQIVINILRMDTICFNNQ
ncbi:predicted protein [Naegleria gruberi]|uniref:Predicted protein n=1 Tax=Naegleria gruberi TaxID=5762 RepID=D2V9Q8_NAEGR|nr:uncharacterized protein NAEGRDRAFT_65524 [Naegleria gruberi]EFC46628.1 predicted protein [Naegleria gruberi]|eukprot:XP_002679372.1 predicted protein [Naegleria gruberi strain NEG-M]